MIEIKNLSFIYNEGTPFETKAIDNISLSIKDNSFVGVIGHTGSGKSTFIQHLNALIKPSSGSVIIDGLDINDEKNKKSEIRKKVGMVFQYPEHQLFEESVYKDVAFGPGNLNLSDKEIESRVKEALEDVHLDYEDIKDRSPFELSGGQKRRVAIAGVLAMKPSVLVLDEPTAGLDPRAREEILDEIYKFYIKNKITVIFVTHSMEDVAKYADSVIVLNKGRLVMHDTTIKVFSRRDELKEIELGVPEISEFMYRLKRKYKDINSNALTIEQAHTIISDYFREKRND